MSLHVSAQTPAENVAPGTFGAQVRTGTYIFPSLVGIGGAPSIENLSVVGTDVGVPGDLNVGGTLIGGNIQAKYQDVAEWVPSGEELSPGTVVVLDRKHLHAVSPSMKPYDTAVAGVVSEKPGVILGEAAPDKSKIATTGRVLVNVDASAPIEVGDLLVTSDIRGMAMKSEPLSLGGAEVHRPGTIIGKALEPLASGRGKIMVLLSLQ